MNTKKYKKIVDEIFKNRPTKEVYEKCLSELITEKNKIIPNEENKKRINNYEKLIESIQKYSSIASK